MATAIQTNGTPGYLVASDFDQTLSFNDSGYVLSEMLGISDFQKKVDGLSRSNLVHQGAELAYLLRHDPEFRSVRREHLAEAGKRVRLKDDVKIFAEVLRENLEGNSFRFFVISASPREVVQSALEGIVPPENVFGTEFGYDPSTGEISRILRVPAGYGKVAVLQDLELKLRSSPDRTIYVGDGSSDLYVMHHVNSHDGHTIAVSETKSIGRVAQRTVLSDNALSVLKEMIRLDPQDPRAHAELGDIYVGRGLLEKGIAELRLLADIYLRRNQFDEAGETLRRIGDISAEMGNSDDAFMNLRRAVELKPNDMDLLREVVGYCYQIGRSQEATQYQSIIARHYFETNQVKESVAGVAAVHEVRRIR
jgi:HAD superfamily phosphoserine phosphatase-like hydrolase